MSKIGTMKEAIGELVRDGDSVAIEGFTHLICFAAGHEIIRQRRRDLTLCRLTPDVIYDQMIAAGCASRLVFSWLGNPGVSPLHAIRRAIEKGVPNSLEIEEYSHFGMVARFVAGAAKLPFYPVRNFAGSDIPNGNPRIVEMQSPYGAEKVHLVPPLNPDVTVIHAQRADENGNAQIWGLLGVQAEAAFAADRVIVAVEEIVSEDVIRADPNRTVIPGIIVDAVVHEPYGAHPSYAQGYYDRDNEFYIAWDKVSGYDKDTLESPALDAWLKEWVYDLPDRAAYVEKMGHGVWERLRPTEALSGSVDYGYYGQEAAK